MDNNTAADNGVGRRDAPRVDWCSSSSGVNGACQRRAGRRDTLIPSLLPPASPCHGEPRRNQDARRPVTSLRAPVTSQGVSQRAAEL